MREAYTQAGVDVEAGYEAIGLIKAHAKRTDRPEVLSGIGGFGALFSVKALLRYDDPVLVSGADGVGTKLQIAILENKHDTVGQDVVAMCVNDIVCSGAEPMFFLDYIAAGKIAPAKIGALVGGIADGCKLAGCALVGGETAEHPGTMPEDEYDLAGFAVGVAERADIIDGESITAGCKIIGLASSGAHSNGFSLIRKILNITHTNEARQRLSEFVPMLNNTLGAELLTPTRIYVKSVLQLMKAVRILGASHITGGGLIENIPRILPPGVCARLYKNAWNPPKIFEYLMGIGGYVSEDFYGVFNMGIGMVVIVSAEQAHSALAVLKSLGEDAAIIGDTTTGGGIVIC